LALEYAALLAELPFNTVKRQSGLEFGGRVIRHDEVSK